MNLQTTKIKIHNPYAAALILLYKTTNVELKNFEFEAITTQNYEILNYSTGNGVIIEVYKEGYEYLLSIDYSQNGVYYIYLQNKLFKLIPKQRNNHSKKAFKRDVRAVEKMILKAFSNKENIYLEGVI